MKHFKSVLLLTLFASSTYLPSALAQEKQIGPINSNFVQREWAHDESIEQISKSVYRFGSDNQFGAYILTDEGIVVVDGHYCGSATPAWLKQQLKERHNVPVKYVILSHDHASHTCGTEVFNDTAVGIGSRNILPHMVFENRQSIIPKITFTDEMDLHLGGVHIRLMYLGPSHSDNLIQVHVPDEKVLIAIDSAKGFSTFPDVRDMDVNNQLLVYKKLAYMPVVDVVLPGHGPVKDQTAFSDAAIYLEALKKDVLERMAAGETLEQIKVGTAAVMMDKFGGTYKNMDRFLMPEIVTMYDYLFRYREPNISIKQFDAQACVEDSTKCRTSSVKP